MLPTIFLIQILILGALGNENVTEVLNTPKETLTLLLMGDTQYHFPCEPGNVACKRASKRCRDRYGLDYYLRFPLVSNDTVREGSENCTVIESRYANRVQRQAISSLIDQMQYKPSALIINGDLTNFGHLPQLNEFSDVWKRKFPIRLLVGLGNHDYENNINDCLLNFCAHTMMSWFMKYGEEQGLNLDYKRTPKSAFEVKYNGSFAYSTRVCSITGKNCAQIIQLNNAFDYEKSFATMIATFNIFPGTEFLIRQLRLHEDLDLPILINFHQCEGTRVEKIKKVISDWLLENKQKGRIKKVGVFFAHMHSIHELRVHCIHNISVPFVYIGSVPNNRFSMIKINNGSLLINGFYTKDSFGLHDRLEHLGETKDLWQPCNQLSQTRYAFMDELTKEVIFKQKFWKQKN